MIVLSCYYWCIDAWVVERIIIYNTFNVKVSNSYRLWHVDKKKNPQKHVHTRKWKEKHFYDQCFAIPAVYWAVWFVDISFII